MPRNPARDLATLQQQRAKLGGKLERAKESVALTEAAIAAKDEQIAEFDGVDAAVNAAAAETAAEGKSA